jgi:hypothetical protein
MQHVFVSYSHEDKDRAEQLKQALADHGIEAWLAGDEIRPGERVVDRIRESLELASAVVLLIGRQSSNWARYEWSQALELSWGRDLNLPVVPVVLNDADPPSFLRNKQILRVSDRDGDWGQVARTLQTATPLDWQSSDGEGGRLTQRLVELEKTAAALPVEPA